MNTKPGDFFMFYKIKQADMSIGGDLEKEFANQVQNRYTTNLKNVPNPGFKDTAKGMFNNGVNAAKQSGGDFLQGLKNAPRNFLDTGKSLLTKGTAGEAPQALKAVGQSVQTAPAAFSSAIKGIGAPLKAGITSGSIWQAAKNLGGGAVNAASGLSRTGLKGGLGGMAADLTGGFAARQLGGTGTSTGSTLVDVASSLHPAMLGAKAVTAPVAAGAGNAWAKFMPSWMGGNGQAAELGSRFGKGGVVADSIGKGFVNNANELRQKNMAINQAYMRSSPATANLTLGKPAPVKNHVWKLTDY